MIALLARERRDVLFKLFDAAIHVGKAAHIHRILAPLFEGLHRINRGIMPCCSNGFGDVGATSNKGFVGNGQMTSHAHTTGNHHVVANFATA